MGFNILYLFYSIYNWLQDLDGKRNLDPNSIDMDDMHLPLPQDDDIEDLSEYKFSKFASMYFQTNASPTYIRSALRESLLPMKSDGDKLVGCFT